MYRYIIEILVALFGFDFVSETDLNKLDHLGHLLVTRTDLNHITALPILDETPSITNPAAEVPTYNLTRFPLYQQEAGFKINIHFSLKRH